MLIGADGPKGTAVAERVGDGVFAAGLPNSRAAGRRYALLQFGTVLDEGEDVRSERVVDAVGHAIAVLFHAMYERGGADAVLGLPGGAEWVASVDGVPERERHLFTHEGHLVRVKPEEKAAVMAAADLIPAMSFSGTAGELKQKVADYEGMGVTEIAYQPAGPDVPGELRRMAKALGL